MKLRESYVLTKEERREFLSLPKNNPFSAPEAWNFWDKVARRLSVDVFSILTDETSMGYVRFTALPLGHDKQWCYPYTLKCTTDPKTVEY